jgi:hypothetical protein
MKLAGVIRWISLSVLIVISSLSFAQNSSSYSSANPIPGPYVGRSDVVAVLDRLVDGDCTKSGSLAFACLLQARSAASDLQSPTKELANPFNLNVASRIRSTVESDLAQVGAQQSADSRLNKDFLVHKNSRVELVGIVNRMDRLFFTETENLPADKVNCGEVSAVYRFSYSDEKSLYSRLPVTLNIVFSARPSASTGAALRCSDIAQRWLDELELPNDRPVNDVVQSLTDPKKGIVSLLSGKDIKRIELNFQAYRVPALADKTGMGSTAEYVIRVFRWGVNTRVFMVSHLLNQIDRARLTGKPTGDQNSCNKGVSKPLLKKELETYLLSSRALKEIDSGTLNIPLKYLACRAVSVSPGGPMRSGNQPFWNTNVETQQILSDVEIQKALNTAVSSNSTFAFVKSPDDVRTRLNEMSCSGCHQTRAIAGFHFPGEDRNGKGSSFTNSVFLPGSAHFFGDQYRRLDLLKKIASGAKIVNTDLAASYSSRPHEKYSDATNSQLIGGWGGVCLRSEKNPGSLRQWGCRSPLKCVLLTESSNAPGIGTCVPESGNREIGDALQIGKISSKPFGVDFYKREEPKNSDALIPESALPKNPPNDNSYYGSHQEGYVGKSLTKEVCLSDADPIKCFRDKRDAQTGGFPNGMLRLSECKGLPNEATCALLAASGFNSCIAKIASGGKTLDQCFVESTAYAGVRACTAISPCRDDYICLKPMGYNLANGVELFQKRREITKSIFSDLDFGQKRPDDEWLKRNNGKGDQRGVCIPPYFVFQFRSDKHPPPQ